MGKWVAPTKVADYLHGAGWSLEVPEMHLGEQGPTVICITGLQQAHRRYVL